MTDLSPCGEIVRKGDPVRFRTALFAPPDAREGLFALYAFNLEIAKIAPLVSEPMIGEIRLQWWRDTLDMIGEGRVRSHEVVQPLAAVIGATNLPRAPFDALIDARAHDLAPIFPAQSADLTTYLRDTAGSLALLAMRAMGGEADTVALDAGQGIGTARYLAALPVLAGQGGRPLPGEIDWRAVREGKADPAFAQTISDMAAQGRAAIARARKTRSTLPPATSPAFMEVAAADRALAAIAQGPATLAALAEPAASLFRANFSTLWRSITRRW